VTSVDLPRSTPSRENVDAVGIRAFAERLEALPGVEPHSLMILRHGRVIADAWWTPYAPERPHLLYSLSKSFTSTAVAFAVAEGLMGLDDTVISHFPELDADVTDPGSRSIRVRHLLAMASGHREETVQRARQIDPDDLVRGFLMIPPDEDPGTLFCYNQPCTYTLAAIVQKHSGQSLTEYLRPRLLDPLGIGEVGWQTDSSGRQLGFTGFFAPTGAVAKLGQLYLQRGSWNGAQLLSPEWVDEATRMHSDNSMRDEPDWRQGYGFQFWMSQHGYRGDGAFGQFCLVLPEHDAVVAITSQSPDMQAMLSAAWAELLPALGETDGPARGGADEDDLLAAWLRERRLPWQSSGGGASASDVAGGYRAERGNDHPSLTEVAVVPGPDDGWTVTLREGDESLELAVGRGGPVVSQAFAASGSVVDEPSGASTLHVDVVFLETPHRLHLVLNPSSREFTARWETPPLEPTTLSGLRSPVRASAR
jgi:CubicO group peptidase (beta-lactamase class C family)